MSRKITRKDLLEICERNTLLEIAKKHELTCRSNATIGSLIELILSKKGITYVYILDKMKVVELKKACDLAQVERSGKKRVLQDLLLSAISRKTGRLEKKEPSINQDQKSILKKDAIIIHGMFSNASNMRGLKKSLAKRGCYREIHAISINRLDHTHIPQLKAKENAKRICEIEIPKLKKNDKNFHRFDVIGHSNGGYVGLAMASMLEEDILDCVFTVATPKGIADTLIDYDIRHRSSTKIIHFRGGVDSVPFGYQHNPGNGGVVISFPDEGHSSIHLGSDTNGLADMIAYIGCQIRPEHMFIDSDGVFHIWPYCQEDKVPGDEFAVRDLFYRQEIIVCNGMHDLKLESLKSDKEFICKVLDGNVRLAPQLIKRFAYYFRVKSHLDAIYNEQLNNLELLRVEKTRVTKEYQKLKRDNDILYKKLNNIDSRFSLFLNESKRRLNSRLERALTPMVFCELLLSQVSVINNETMREINRLLSIAEREFDVLNEEIRKTSGIKPNKNYIGVI